MKKISLSFLLVTAFASLLWLPNLFTKGMFVDGVYDALFAHNLFHGVGSFWSPQTADYAHPAYWDNPQLSAYFLSLWYKVFGDFYWVEKFYSLFCAVIQLLLLALLWEETDAMTNLKSDIKKESVNSHGISSSEKNYFWLPCLLFMIIPLTSWGYSSNLMENTMSIFTTSSVIVFLIYLRLQKNILLYSTTGGVLIFLALLTKGPVALFPLAAPLFFIWSEKNLSWKKPVLYMLLQFSAAAIIFAFVFSMNAPQNFLQHYLDVQLFRALKTTGAFRVDIFLQLSIALLPLLVFSAVSFFINRKAISENKRLFQTALVFILIGLSASVPIALSAKQNKHYLLPSLPLFATGFSCLVLPLVKRAEKSFKEQSAEKISAILKTACLLVIFACGLLSAKNAGTYSRDEKLLADLEQIQSLAKNQNVIRADWNLYDDWALRANLNRWYDKKICMPDEDAATDFYLTKSNEGGDGLPVTAQKIYSGNKFDLYRF